MKLIYYSSTKGAVLRKGDLVIVSKRRGESFSRVELYSTPFFPGSSTEFYAFRVKNLFNAPIKRVLDLYEIGKDKKLYHFTQFYGISFYFDGAVFDHIENYTYKKRL